MAGVWDRVIFEESVTIVVVIIVCGNQYVVTGAPKAEASISGQTSSKQHGTEKIQMVRSTEAALFSLAPG